MDADTYEPWGFQALSDALSREHIEIGKTSGQSVVRAEDVQRALDARVDTPAPKHRCRRPAARGPAPTGGATLDLCLPVVPPVAVPVVAVPVVAVPVVAVVPLPVRHSDPDLACSHARSFPFGLKRSSPFHSKIAPAASDESDPRRDHPYRAILPPRLPVGIVRVIFDVCDPMHGEVKH